MELDSDAIMRIIPHRPPFLFVDRILEVEESRIVGTYRLHGDEWFLPGHFPGAAIMPGVLIVEAIAQAGACLALRRPEFVGRVPYFAGMEEVRFRRPVRPGEVLTLQAELLWLRGRSGRLRGRALVGDDVAAEGEFIFVMGEALG
ncbi:MAG TPA: 3-hydroxyacyl-ACP dehydratase FabZ [bacterium]|nr:3-hydroxyacyl-ACP dehydratase FabZ [bacterium]